MRVVKEDIVELTRQTFSKEFLKLSPKINELSDVLWFMFKAGGSAPVDIVSAMFPSFNRDMEHLKNAGIIEIKDERLAIFTEKLEDKLLRNNLTTITNQDMASILLDNYWDELSRSFGLEGLENSLGIVLSAVIVSSTPDQPAFMSKFLRTCDILLGESDKVMKTVIGDPTQILDHYLCRSLELVRPVENFGVALTEKAQSLIKKNKELWEIYSGKSGKTKAEKPVSKNKSQRFGEHTVKDVIEKLGIKGQQIYSRRFLHPINSYNMAARLSSP
ncbi:MAG: hypothetical protein HY051_00235 [Candidatus Aenigmarchaeota archaeon]|nr:hypothetical protein [Candidatus Aenigmarchaeota archaeon]